MKQIKSKKRVKDFAEVFTAEREVKAMCDLIPKETWDNIESTFLEPACGNGQFLVEIFARKLERCKDEKDGLKALASIVGIDIQQDNVIESRERLRKMYLEKFKDSNSFCVYMLDTILKNNIICANSLEKMQEWIDQNEPKQLSMFDIIGETKWN